MNHTIPSLLQAIKEHVNQDDIKKLYLLLSEKTEKLLQGLPEWWYPKHPIAADIWLLWAEIYDACYEIFGIIQSTGNLEMQQKFLWIWSTATFSVVPHYRRYVWALMTETMYFFERKWEMESIPRLAASMFHDFECLLDIDEEESTHDNETIYGINYLIIACQKMREYWDDSEVADADRIFERIQHLPESIQKHLSYEHFSYVEWGKILPSHLVGKDLLKQ